jgi:FeS assembly SUF system protein
MEIPITVTPVHKPSTSDTTEVINPKNDGVLTLKEKVIEVIMDIYDPEVPVNIYDLGLIYNIETNDEGEVRIEMTLTSPACPVAETLPQTVQDRVLSIATVTKVSVSLVWEPPWTKDRMTEIAKLQLNMF